MTELKAIQFLLLISSMIFSTHALRVFLTDGDGENGFQYETQIKIRIDENGIEQYNGCVINNCYTPGPATTIVIVYIKNHRLMKRTALRRKCRDKRIKITEKLSAQHYEILYLSVTDHRSGDERFIAEFLLQSIDRPYSQIKTIGEKTLNREYKSESYVLDRYKEDMNVFKGKLQEELRSMDA